MNTSPLRLTIAAGIAKIVLDNQSRRNAMGPAMVAALRRALDEVLARQAEVRALVLTGEGRAFCSGGDMAESEEITSAKRAGAGDDAGDHYTLETHHHPVLRRLRELPVPIITALNGPAIGMGMSYALYGDLIVAKRSAYLSARFVKVGMSPDAGVSWLLPRLIGSARAREMLLLGENVPAPQALEWGLINRVFEDDSFETETMTLAARVAAGPPLALDRIRALCWEAWRLTHEEHLHLEEKRQMELSQTDDALEGFSAFLAKRDAVFHGR